MNNIAHFNLIDTASAYVKAAQEDTIENINLIKQTLANPLLRTKTEEHNDALKRAVSSNNLHAVTLILNHANLDSDIAITPFSTADDDDRQDLCRAVLNAALQNSSSNIIMLLLRQTAIQDFLLSIRRDDYTFSLLKNMLAEQKNLRAGCEIIQIASQGKLELLPSFILELTPYLLDSLHIIEQYLIARQNLK